MQIYDPRGHRMTPEEALRTLSSRDLRLLNLASIPSHNGESSPWERINSGEIIPEKMPVHSGPYRETLGDLPRTYQDRQH